MKVIIAPDSFKDSLTASDAAQAMASGWQRVFPDAELILCPMADGGEGTLAAINAVCAGEWQQHLVQGPMGDATPARWLWLPHGHVAIIEMSQASGLQLLAPQRRNAGASSTYGTGELIRAALDMGAEEIILTIGGSATNDAGAGMLTALGARLLDREGRVLPSGGLALRDLATIDLDALDGRLRHTRFLLAADVDNPLCGPDGASHTFGPQKSASAAQVQALDAALAHFADLSAALLGTDHRHEAGSGAAGGLGFAAKAYLHARFQAGVEVVAALHQLADKMKHADWVITGEGQFDRQTLHGKTPLGVAKIAQAANVPVIVVAGTLGEHYQDLYAHGISAAFSLTDGPISLEDACGHAAMLLEARVVDIARLIKSSMRTGLGT